jgi:hypothetical protein
MKSACSFIKTGQNVKGKFRFRLKCSRYSELLNEIRMHIRTGEGGFQGEAGVWLTNIRDF